MKKRRIKRALIARCIIFICLIAGLSSCYNIYKWQKDVHNNEKIKHNINHNIKKIKDKKNKNDTYEINFSSLKKQNNDTVAYLKVNNTKIDYIVVKGKDNIYYLNHNFDKQYNKAGWIFADFHNKFDENDKNIVIFGHNTKDGSMFGTLTNVLKKEWYQNENNHIITLTTNKKTYYYQVFSTYSSNPESYYIKTSFTNNDEFSQFVTKLKSRSIYNYDIDINGNDHILTLSSCISDGKKRVVLHAKLIN